MELVEGAAAIGKFIFSEFMSNIFNDNLDTTREGIKKKIHNKEDQSFSTKICRVIESTINHLTNHKYAQKDVLYEAVEKIILEFKNDRDGAEAVKSGLRLLIGDISDSRYQDFIDKFYNNICEDDYLHKRVSFILQKKEIRITQNGFQQLSERNDYEHAEFNRKLDVLMEHKNIDIKTEKFRNNRKEDYIKTLNSKLFLHSDDNPITLKEAFITPNFIIHKFSKNIKITRSETLGSLIRKFFAYEKTSTLLLIGMPGIGKTSMAAWMADQYRENDDVIILRFRDWEGEELGKGLLKAICEVLGCKKRDLEKKILILDGLDEIKALHIRGELLNEFLSDIKDFENFKCIITSRPAYIITSYYFHNIIELRAFDIGRIEKFYKKIAGNNLAQKAKIISNVEVLGIPVILYMAIMADIDISKNPTKPELYNRIFGKTKGIFDKFYDGETEYSGGSQMLRDPENIKLYLEFLGDIAYQMFVKNVMLLRKNECKIPELEFERKKVSILDFPIKHLFENTELNIEFIHKSIYEYFVSEYIYALIYHTMSKEKDKDKHKLREELAGVFGTLFKDNRLTKEILEFLRYKIRKGGLNERSDIISEVFGLMLQDGMIYYTGLCCKNAMECEIMVFANMLEIVHLWNAECLKMVNLISNYLRHNTCTQLNLKGVYLEGASLIRIDLRSADLRNANMKKAKLLQADLKGADLRNTKLNGADMTEINLKMARLTAANLEGTNLREADLSRADLIDADLRKAKLRGADLTGADLRGADLRDANLRGAKLRNANLERARVKGADLIGTDLEGAYLTETVFDEEQVRLLSGHSHLSKAMVWLNGTGKKLTYKDYMDIISREIIDERQFGKGQYQSSNIEHQFFNNRG